MKSKPDIIIIITLPHVGKVWRIRAFVGLWRRLTIHCRLPGGETVVNNGRGTVTKLTSRLRDILKEVVVN